MHELTVVYVAYRTAPWLTLVPVTDTKLILRWGKKDRYRSDNYSSWRSGVPEKIHFVSHVFRMSFARLSYVFLRTMFGGDIMGLSPHLCTLFSRLAQTNLARSVQHYREHCSRQWLSPRLASNCPKCVRGMEHKSPLVCLCPKPAI